MGGVGEELARYGGHGFYFDVAIGHVVDEVLPHLVDAEEVNDG